MVSENQSGTATLRTRTDINALCSVEARECDEPRFYEGQYIKLDADSDRLERLSDHGWLKWFRMNEELPEDETHVFAMGGLTYEGAKILTYYARAVSDGATAETMFRDGGVPAFMDAVDDIWNYLLESGEVQPPRDFSDYEPTADGGEEMAVATDGGREEPESSADSNSEDDDEQSADEIPRADVESALDELKTNVDAERELASGDIHAGEGERGVRHHQMADGISEISAYLRGRLVTSPSVADDEYITRELLETGLSEVEQRISEPHHTEQWKRGARESVSHLRGRFGLDESTSDDDGDADADSSSSDLGLEPSEFAAVIGVEYEHGERVSDRVGSRHGLDRATADELGDYFRELATSDGALVSDRAREVLDSLSRTLSNGVRKQAEKQRDDSNDSEDDDGDGGHELVTDGGRVETDTETAELVSTLTDVADRLEHIQSDWSYLNCEEISGAVHESEQEIREVIAELSDDDTDELDEMLKAAKDAGAHDDFVAFVAEYPDSGAADTLETAISLDALDDFLSLAGSFVGALWKHGAPFASNPDTVNERRIRELFEPERWPEWMQEQYADSEDEGEQ